MEKSYLLTLVTLLVVEFRQWILVGLIIVFAVAEGIQRQVDGVAEGDCIGFVAARDAVARSGVGGGVHEWQTGSKEYAILGVEKWNGVVA